MIEVTAFWLGILCLHLAWRVFILKRALRLANDWQERAMRLVVRAFSLQPHEKPDDMVLDSEVIE